MAADGIARVQRQVEQQRLQIGGPISTGGNAGSTSLLMRIMAGITVCSIYSVSATRSRITSGETSPVGALRLKSGILCTRSRECAAAWMTARRYSPSLSPAAVRARPRSREAQVRREAIANIVRDAAAKLSDCRDLLRVLLLLLQSAAEPLRRFRLIIRMIAWYSIAGCARQLVRRMTQHRGTARRLLNPVFVGPPFPQSEVNGVGRQLQPLQIGARGFLGGSSSVRVHLDTDYTQRTSVGGALHGARARVDSALSAVTMRRAMVQLAALTTAVHLSSIS
jgi:hypothetical protein